MNQWIYSRTKILKWKKSKNATRVHTLYFAKKTDLINLKSGVDKLDPDKLKNVPSGLNTLKSKVGKLNLDKLIPLPVDLSQLSHMVKVWCS